jgi:hypothetical protein
MEKAGIAIDRGRRLLAVRGQFNAPRQPLEYLVTAPRGSHYESLIQVAAKPSDIAAGLLYLGVERGEPPAKRPKSPPPSEEERSAGVLPYEVLPGTGGGVFVYVEWNDDRGFHRHRIEELVFERPEGRTIPHGRFLFVNSAILEPRSSKETRAYAADLDGNLVTCGFGGAPVLAYVKPHPFALQSDYEIYQPNWTLVPSETSGVTLILSAEELVTPLLPRMAPPPASLPASGPAPDPK